MERGDKGSWEGNWDQVSSYVPDSTHVVDVPGMSVCRPWGVQTGPRPVCVVCLSPYVGVPRCGPKTP